VALSLLPLFLAAAVAAAPSASRTLRVDYIHSGNAGEEHLALDGVVLEGPWAGAPESALDDTGLGKYRVEVVDSAGGRLLFSRGFASVYGEWETTGEAKQRSRAFHESVRFPEPAGPVRVELKKRAAGGAFRPLWSVVVDPADPGVDRAGTAGAGSVWAVEQNGPPSEKVDVLLMGDGYTASEMDKWHRDARRLAGMLFAVSPFRERRRDFNVWAVDTPAAESGVARPSDGVHRRSPLRAAYDAFGSERYVLSFDDKRIREAAAAAPYEFVEIVVNERKYGGGGIFGQYATVAADNTFSPYILVHEFGHHFAGLADEYYTSEVAYESDAARPEPWEPNVTADPGAARWRDVIAPGTPLPTPWEKAAFESTQREIQARRRAIRAQRRPEEEMETLFREERATTTRLLLSGPHAGKVGAFEGAMYEARGYYRPQADCIMFTRDEVGFCAVCRRAIERVIDHYARRAVQ
jgi:hypothetical protein